MDRRNPVLEMLQVQRAQIEQDCAAQLREIDLAIERLRRAEDIPSAAAIVPGMFENLGITHALTVYLNIKGTASIREAAADLLKGGCDLGIPERRERNLKITITNNKKLFRLDEPTDTVELVRAKGKK